MPLKSSKILTRHPSRYCLSGHLLQSMAAITRHLLFPLRPKHFISAQLYAITFIKQRVAPHLPRSTLLALCLASGVGWAVIALRFRVASRSHKMSAFIKDVGMALLGGWIIGVAFAGMKLVPLLMGLI
jgi:hypothetical protein